jgi:KUP system potassium uptake protein
LEDKFDDANRKNLRHFIVTNGNGNLALPSTYDMNTSKPESITEQEELETASVQAYYYLAKDGKNDNSGYDDEKSVEEKRELVRIPTCAVFHKVSGGKGVPHSFVCELALKFC